VQKGRIKRLPRLRDVDLDNDLWIRDFLSSDATYGARFREHNRIPKSLYDRLEDELRDQLQQGPDAVGVPSVPIHVQILGTLQYLGDASSSVTLDRVWRYSPATILKHVKSVCTAIVTTYEGQYLRDPSPETMLQIAERNAQRGFPGCIGSLDCMHVPWPMCPTTWKGAFKGR
jgi:hypothetical protein